MAGGNEAAGAQHCPGRGRSEKPVARAALPPHKGRMFEQASFAVSGIPQTFNSETPDLSTIAVRSRFLTQGVPKVFVLDTNVIASALVGE